MDMIMQQWVSVIINSLISCGTIIIEWFPG